MPDRSCPSNYIAARSEVTRDWFSVCCRLNMNYIYIFRFFKGLRKKIWSLPSLNMLTSNFMMIILTSILTVLSSKYGEKEACLNCSYGGSFINGRCVCKEDSKSAGNSTHNFSTTINNFDKWKEEHYRKEKNNVRCPAFLSMNYWVNLHTEGTVMWITASENCIILHFMGSFIQKPNSITVSLFTQNIFKFLGSEYP